MNKPIIIISGATATGKTSTSINLAKALASENRKAEIINFDSLLFYKELTIGTAKPTLEEQGNIKHWLIDIRSIKDPINAADFTLLCLEKINELHSKNIIPILIGGSAFYLRAIIKGMYESPTVSVETKQKVENIYLQEGIEKIRELLQQVDITSFNNLHANDHYRNVRAYEHFLETGLPFSLEKERMDEADPYDFTCPQNPDWKLHHIYLEIPKEKHWEIMLQRTNQMLQAGLIDEVNQLLKSGFSGQEKPLSSIGYKESLAFIKSEISSEKELSEKIYFATRRLAKSQKTFFNKISPKQTYNPLNDQDKIFQDSKAFLELFC